MVGIANLLVAIALLIAGLLGRLAEQLPEMIPDAVPAACVQVPVLNQGGLQVGYCP